MIKIFDKKTHKQISNSEYMEFLRSSFINNDFNTPLSEHFIMLIDGKEVNIDNIGFKS